MARPLLIYFLLQGVLLYDTLAWEVKMPKKIHGLKDSCLVIPCSFHYTSHPPENPREIVWYQWVSEGYPLVYDPRHPYEVIHKFRGKTDLYGDPSHGDCSLLITTVAQSHNAETLYTWIDPEHIGWRTYKFYDVTSTISVDTQAEQPEIYISGGEKIDDHVIKVTCITYHTCPYKKPTIILNGIEGPDSIVHEDLKNGRWKISLTRTGFFKAEHPNIECSVTHHGGITATATSTKTAKCSANKLVMSSLPENIEPGTRVTVTCSVKHTCQSNPPDITWNIPNAQAAVSHQQMNGGVWETVSTVTFILTGYEMDKDIVCSAKFFLGGTAETSAFLNARRSFGLETFGPYVIAFSLVFLSICIIVGVIICKRQRRQPPDEMQGRREQRRSLWNRFSRFYERRPVSLYRGNYNIRQSIWSRFSRRHSPRTHPDMRAEYKRGRDNQIDRSCITKANNTCAVSGNNYFKPPMPSPKSEPKSCSGYNYDEDYTNTADLNIYRHT